MRLPRFLSHQRVRFLLGVLVTLVMLLHAAAAYRLDFVDALERVAYDARLQWSMPGGQDRQIVIVDIDEASLQQEGHWPWSRHKLALLLDQLFDQYQTQLVAFDIVFAERDESLGLQALHKLRDTALAKQPEVAQAMDALMLDLDDDERFAKSMQGRNIVLGYYFRHGDRAQVDIGELPPPVMSADTLAYYHIASLQASGYGANLPILQQQARGAGHFNPAPDTDGITRRIPLLVAYQDGIYEALSLAVLRQVLGDVPLIPSVAESLDYAGLEWLQLGERKIPVDANLNVLIPYRGRQGSFAYVSAADVLHGKVPVAQLKHKIVLVGTTAPGLMDLRATPMQSVYPGVEIHANMIAGMLDGNVKAQPAYLNGAEFLLLLLLGVGLSITLPRLRPLPATVLASGLLGLLIFSSLIAWQQLSLVLPLASALLLVTLVYLINMSYGYFIESRSKRHLAQLFGQYVPPELVEEMAERPPQFGLQGESRYLTVLFCDIRGFTSIAETLPPSTLAQLMNAYLTAMTRVIHQHRGTIDKYMGDAIMAFWGAPLHDEQHAKNAVHATLGMLLALEQVNADFQQKGWPTLRIGIGLNSGEMTVGNMGSEFRMAYTVLGDAVNLGARLEGLCEHYAESILLSEATVRLAPQYRYRELDLVRVKGKGEPVKIYAPIAANDTVTELELAQYELALAAYRQQQWQQAETAFVTLIAIYGERRIYHIYLERIRVYSQHAPGNAWDGVFNFESKRGIV